MRSGAKHSFAQHSVLTTGRGKRHLASTRDDESTLPHLPFGCFCLRLKKKKKIYFENLKKISYEPHRNFLQPRIVKNLLRKWSRFCKNIL